MHKRMMKKLMAYVLTMALSCSVFMGTSITGNATSALENEVTETELSENKNSDAILH